MKVDNKRITFVFFDYGRGIESTDVLNSGSIKKYCTVITGLHLTISAGVFQHFSYFFRLKLVNQGVLYAGCADKPFLALFLSW